MGPDGAGKTTTLRMLCGLMDPTEGSARVAGHDVARESQAVKDQIGYMAQRFGLYGDLTVEENMIFYADLFGITGAEREDLTRATAAHDAHGAVPRAAGRAALGRHEAEAGADVHAAAPARRFCFSTSRPTAWIRFRGAISGPSCTSCCKDGITIFMTTAYLDEAERCNRVGLMHKGKLIRCEAPDEMKRATATADSGRRRSSRRFTQWKAVPRHEHETAVEIDDLVKTFGAFVAVDHVSLQVEKGEIFGFLGPNGAGKSTTIRILCGLLTPTSGTRLGERLRRGDAARGDPPQHRVHVAEVLAVRRSHGGGEHRFLQRASTACRASVRAERKEYVLEMANLAERRGALTRHALGRLEAAAGAGLRDPARPAGAVPGRAHVRRGPDRARRVLGPDPRPLGDRATRFSSARITWTRRNTAIGWR